MLFNLSKKNSGANDFLIGLRDVNLQQDRMRFRKNMERLGEIMAYEVSQQLKYKPQEVITQLGKVVIPALEQQPLLITILRAGLPYFQGFVNFFDKADCGFIGAYREEYANDLTIKLSYVATQSLQGKTVLLIDPMLATGRSVADAIAALLRHGAPQHIHIISLVAAPEGIQYLKKKVTVPFSIWTCAIDEKLDENFYIVPGLGDAGDLSYGIKI
jgi:uracil phosphoribosyltransferase